MDVSTMIPLASGMDSPADELDEMESNFSQTIEGIRAAQKKHQQEFEAEYKAIRENMRQMMFPKQTGAVTPELQELSIVLQQNPAIVPTVLTFAKTVVENIKTTIQSQLAASLSAVKTQ